MTESSTRNIKDILTKGEVVQKQSATQKPPPAYRQFTASELYCPKCGRSNPVKERLLLYLAHGALYDYSCARCGDSVGTRQT